MTNRTANNQIVAMIDALPAPEREALRVIAEEDDALFCEILGEMLCLAVITKSGNMTAWKRMRAETERSLKDVTAFLENSARN